MNILASAPPNKSWNSADCSRNGILAVACGNFVLLIDVQQRKLVGELHGHRKRIFCVRYQQALAIKHLLATASADGTVKVWDTDLKREIRSIQHSETIIDCFFSNLHPYILLILGDDSTLYSWDLTSNNKREKLQPLSNGHSSLKGNISSVELTCSDLLLLGLWTGVIVAWSVFDSSHVQKSFYQHNYPIHSITSYSNRNVKQSEYFYSICEDGLFCCWNTNHTTPYYMFSIKEKISSFSTGSKGGLVERHVMKCVSPSRIIVAPNCLCKPILVEIPSKDSTSVSYNETSVVHRSPIMSLLFLQSRQWLISIAMDGCIALWDAESFIFHNWILKGLIGFPLSFSLAKDSQYPVVIGYSNGSIGFVSSRQCFTVRKLPNIQTTKRQSFLSQEENLCDICYIPCSTSCSPNFLAMVTSQGQLIFGRIQFSAPNDKEDPLQEKFHLQKICSTYLHPKKRKNGNKFQLCWVAAYHKEYETASNEENILSLLTTNELIVMESNHSGNILEASLWYLRMSCTNELMWQYRTCLLQELKKISTDMNVHSITCSPDGRFAGIAFNFQRCFVLDVTTLDLVFSTEIAKLHFLSFPQYRNISQTMKEKNSLAFSCTDGRIGLLSFCTDFHSNNNATSENYPMDVIWCETSFQKSIVSLCTIQELTIQVAIALSDGSIQVRKRKYIGTILDKFFKIWFPLKDRMPCKVLPGQRKLILKLEWSCTHPNFIVSIGRDKILRLWDITRWGE